ncbi:LysR family transcriptional regulator [Cupriavidus sp. L7L]|uniref:LysR family transcriptional regulator n=1 Tax=Cupriavidus sp. L7L TaxID=2546443 RepID=UPI0010567F0E|nr:LysR family transcriptional regulator [Cupriavidus sp. L7L]TDF63190.1 LysR family transcriptional regulator [Cupriavidus sp. L7L]
MINFRLIRHLWVFLAVAEEQHFGKAARRLGMTQPPVTEQIQILEQALKVKLFERSSRGAQLTPVGAAILPVVRKFADQLDRLELAVNEAIHGQSGVLTLGCISPALFDTVPRLIERIRADNPRLTVSIKEIDTVDAIPALLSGEIDVAFARLEGDLGPSIRSMPLKQDRLAVALPRSHPLAELTRVRLSALADQEFVMFARHVSPVYFDSLTAACRSAGFSPRVIHEVKTVSSQVGFVGCGQGIALVPASLKKAAPENVVIRPLKEAVNLVTTAVAWSTERENPLVKAVIAALSADNATERKYTG